MTEADLAKTLEGLSAAATRARVLESRVANRWQITLDFGDDRDAMWHFSDLYRTGQLIVVDHPQATSPVDDRGGAVCEQQDVEAVARAIMIARNNGGCIVKDWQKEAKDNCHVAQALRQSQAAIAAMPSLAAKDAEIARLREALDAIRASATGVTFNLADLALASAKPMKEAP